MKIQVRVIPGAQKTAIVGRMDNGVLKVRVAAAPEKDKANKELVRFLADLLNVPRSEVSVIKGRTGQDKTVGLPDVTLGPEFQ